MSISRSESRNWDIAIGYLNIELGSAVHYRLLWRIFAVPCRINTIKSNVSRPTQRGEGFGRLGEGTRRCRCVGQSPPATTTTDETLDGEIWRDAPTRKDTKRRRGSRDEEREEATREEARGGARGRRCCW